MKEGFGVIKETVKNAMLGLGALAAVEGASIGDAEAKKPKTETSSRTKAVEHLALQPDKKAPKKNPENKAKNDKPSKPKPDKKCKPRLSFSGSGDKSYQEVMVDCNGKPITDVKVHGGAGSQEDQDYNNYIRTYQPGATHTKVN